MFGRPLLVCWQGGENSLRLAGFPRMSTLEGQPCCVGPRGVPRSVRAGRNVAPVTQESFIELERTSISPKSPDGNADPGYEDTLVLKGVGAEVALERRLYLPHGTGVGRRPDTSLRV